MVVHDLSKWPVQRKAPCTHNEWVRVSRMEGTEVYLQCRICRAPWRTDLDWHVKCPAHFSGGCSNGSKCDYVHIYRVQPKRRKVWRKIFHNSRKDDEPRPQQQQQQQQQQQPSEAQQDHTPEQQTSHRMRKQIAGPRPVSPSSHLPKQTSPALREDPFRLYESLLHADPHRESQCSADTTPPSTQGDDTDTLYDFARRPSSLAMDTVSVRSQQASSAFAAVTIPTGTSFDDEDTELLNIQQLEDDKDEYVSTGTTPPPPLHDFGGYDEAAFGQILSDCIDDDDGPQSAQQPQAREPVPLWGLRADSTSAVTPAKAPVQEDLVPVMRSLSLPFSSDQTWNVSSGTWGLTPATKHLTSPPMRDSFSYPSSSANTSANPTPIVSPLAQQGATLRTPVEPPSPVTPTLTPGKPVVSMPSSAPQSMPHQQPTPLIYIPTMSGSPMFNGQLGLYPCFVPTSPQSPGNIVPPFTGNQMMMLPVPSLQPSDATQKVNP